MAAGCFAVAAPAMAQQSPASAPELRYLSWSGKAEPASPAPAGLAGQDGLRRYPGIMPRQPVVSAAPQPSPASYASRPSRYSPRPSNRLTPASAWLNTGPQPAAEPYAEPYAAGPAYQPAPQPSYPPAPPAATAPRPMSGPMVASAAAAAYSHPAYSQPAYALPAAPPVYTSAPVDAPRSAYADAPAPSLAAPQPGFEAAFDPMAPRRDAPIFRMGRESQGPAQGAPQPGALSDGSSAPLPMASPPSGAPSTAYAAAEPPREGPRYYSVHRAAGHQPDAMVMPQSVYLDTAPIDLAEPPETPTPARTVNGRAQNVVPNEDPSLP